MSIPTIQRPTAGFLTRLAGGPPHETHVSPVFVGTDTVWKLKKAVRLCRSSISPRTATARGDAAARVGAQPAHRAGAVPRRCGGAAQAGGAGAGRRPGRGGGLGAAHGAGACRRLPRRHGRATCADAGAAGCARRCGRGVSHHLPAGRSPRLRSAMRRVAEGNVRSARDAGSGRRARCSVARRGVAPSSTRARPGSRGGPRRASSAARMAICIWAICASGAAARCCSTRWSSTKRWRPSTSATISPFC